MTAVFPGGPDAWDDGGMSPAAGARADEASCSLVSRPLHAAAAVSRAQVFKALSDPVRLRLLSLISSAPDGEVCVCELTGEFDVTAPTISFHLKVLREAGLVSSRRSATWIYYRIVPETFGQLSDLFDVTALKATA